MKISTIIPAYNNKNHLRMCLKSLESQKMKPSEIIVVDDGSHDGTWEMVRKEFPSVKLIRHSRNKGTCAALNTGIINARHEYIVLLDQDLILPRTWIEKVVEEIKKEKVTINFNQNAKRQKPIAEVVDIKAFSVLNKVAP